MFRTNAYSQLCLLFPISLSLRMIPLIFFFLLLHFACVQTDLAILCILIFVFQHANEQSHIQEHEEFEEEKKKPTAEQQNGNFLHKMCNCVSSGKYWLIRLTKSNAPEHRTQNERNVLKMLPA